MIFFNGGKWWAKRDPWLSPGFLGEYNKCDLFLILFSDGDVLQSKLQQGYYEPDQLVCLNP